MKTTLIVTLLLALAAFTTVVGRTCRQSSIATPIVAEPALLTPVQLHRVRAAREGRLWEVYVKHGDVVQRGQLLAKVARPLHSLEQQEREAEFHRAKQHYSRLVQNNASEAALAQAQRKLAEAGHRVAGAPKLYSFDYITATTSGTVYGRSVRPGQYLTDSSTVSVIATPIPLEVTSGVAAN